MTLPNGRLLHRYRNGKVDISGNLDDYAFFIAALLDVYETTFSVEYLSKALEFNADLINYFGMIKMGLFSLLEQTAKNYWCAKRKFMMEQFLRAIQ
ncbi:MAG: hypothetical protein MZV64_12295 [Ignavibacteriales bacterium]|nr:hypothetical protein [Ignavibacteriales bacterium]